MSQQAAEIVLQPQSQPAPQTLTTINQPLALTDPDEEKILACIFSLKLIEIFSSSIFILTTTQVILQFIVLWTNFPSTFFSSLSIVCGAIYAIHYAFKLYISGNNNFSNDKLAFLFSVL